MVFAIDTVIFMLTANFFPGEMWRLHVILIVYFTGILKALPSYVVRSNPIVVERKCINRLARVVTVRNMSI